jgi:hypothetical protein
VGDRLVVCEGVTGREAVAEDVAVMVIDAVDVKEGV